MRPTDPTRRDVLRTATAGLAAAVPALAQPARPAWQPAILAYLARHARPDGGYAWAGEDESHLTPTHAAVGCHALLGEPVPAADKVAAFVRAGHPFRLKKLERDLRVFELQQVQALLWLKQDASAFRDVVRKWTTPADYPKQYERDGNPVFRNELTAFTCRELLGLPVTDLAPAFVTDLDGRRRDDGSFNNTPAASGGDGHVMNTLWGLQALRSLGRVGEKAAETAHWLRACQLAGGGRRFELYNLRDDLGESRNLAADRPERVKDLDARIDAFLAAAGATYPRPNPAFRGGG